MISRLKRIFHPPAGPGEIPSAPQAVVIRFRAVDADRKGPEATLLQAFGRFRI